jgi:predicted GIY-YIG superfamily endonuclease
MTQSDALKREAAIKKLAVHLKRNIFETEYLKAYA